ncbi:protein LNK1-like [Diospyros lotus]|uniref:protein LNK1-like n=1 Tax=Diospyros lotus TaxID=55363 RepID=UPI00225A41D1|nr:protein LNK1-like [Diospyros lotus]
MKWSAVMSDLCIFELGDIVWDEFGQTDDHIVPQPGNKHGIDPVFQSGSCKKPRHEVIGGSSNSSECYTANYVSHGREGGLKALKNTRDTMMEKDPWSYTPEGVVNASHDGHTNKETTSLSSDNTRTPSHYLKSSDIDAINTDLGAEDPVEGRCADIDNDSYCYPLGEISQSGNELSFLHNDYEDKEPNDLLYYEWPDIENFEDVDKIFRSCDSTFGLGSVANEDELSWFSPSHTIEGSEDVLKSDFKFCFPQSSPLKSMLDQHEHGKLNDGSFSNNGSNVDSTSVSYKSRFQASECGEPDAIGHLTLMNESDALSQSKDHFAPKGQGVDVKGAFSTVKQSKNEKSEMIKFQKEKHYIPSEGKRKERCFENGGSFHHSSQPRLKEIKSPSADSSHQAYTSSNVQKQKKNIVPDSFGYMQTHIPYMNLDYGHPSDQIPVSSTPSTIKSESNGITSLSPKESSDASNQVKSTESSRDCSFGAPIVTVDDKRDKLQHRQTLCPTYMNNLKHGDLVQTTAGNSLSVQMKTHCTQPEVQNQSEGEEFSIRIPVDLDSSNVQESSCMSTGLDEISLDASSFCQLQQVMEQLDIRTKVCIRDSLYRLARSAEQRHHYANLNSGSIDDRDSGGALTNEGTNKSIGFMDMETDTNPIDRSVAHLLFHRPSDSSSIPAHDGLSLKSCNMIHGSANVPPVMVEKLVCQEDAASEADKKVTDQ